MPGTLIITICCFIIMAILHIVFKRTFLKKSLVISFFIAFFISIMIFILLNVIYLYFNYIAINDFVPITICNLIILICADYCYINTVNIVNASVRIKILNEISEAGKGLSEGQILKIYNADEILNSRLERLVKNGQLIIKAGKYKSGKPGQILFAKFFLFWRQVIFGKKL